MNELFVYIPAAVTMLVLLGFSAFFSCCEAAYFSLNKTDRKTLAGRGMLGKLAVRLSEKPEHLLNSILLANLFVNLLIFTISSILTFQVGEKSHWAWIITVIPLFAVILFGEVLPKNFGVTAPHFFALTFAVPLSLLVNLLRPVLPMLNKLNILSRRVLYPDFEPEPYLLAGDLERAVALSGEDAALLKREQRSIQNIVSLSEMQAEELMRPRSLLRIFKPGTSFDEIITELRGTLPLSGYCLLTEPDSEEIASALCLSRLTALDIETSWQERFEPVVYVPWSSPVAEVFERLQKQNRRVAVVINELGETIGIITLDDVIATIFTREQGRSRRLLNRLDIQRISKGIWQLTGLTSLRRLQRHFGESFEMYSSLTVGGLLREMLERFPKTGDVCRVGTLQLRVAAVSEGNDLVVHLSVLSEKK
ncbi:MAG: CNNM domain-containing protein [Planctomycetaceae bacterium]|jgi:CBS domain containing-hemolysin-like protein|nr:CNNM domain-containing protein [Planctomycetaceae bacterium]